MFCALSAPVSATGRSFRRFDQVEGGLGDDQLRGDAGNDTLDGGSGADTAYGGDGDDDIYGGWGDDEIHVGDGADFVKGGKGDDVVHVSGFGGNILQGNLGYDTLVFGNSAVDVSLKYGTAYRSDGTDSFSSFENAITGNGADMVAGTDGANQIFTDGDDDIFGADDDDYLSGDNGDDTVAGGEGSDVIRGGEGADHIYTGDGPDTVRWEQGDEGMDDLFDFDLAEDKLSFGENFFQVQWWEQWDAFNLSDKLEAVDNGAHTLLRAMVNDGSDVGEWQWIARIHDTDHNVVNQMIGNGNNLDVEVAEVGDGASDGFEFGA